METDGLVFDADSIKTSLIQDDQDYPGVRVNLKAFSKRAGLTVAVGNLEAVVEELRKHLLPVLEKLLRK
jgi:hypothetical protein